MAARRGRGDVLRAFARRGASIELHGLERLLAACARHDAATRPDRGRRTSRPRRTTLRTDGGRFLAWFAGVGNTDGVRLLLDLGVADRRPVRRGRGLLRRRTQQPRDSRRRLAREPRDPAPAHRSRIAHRRPDGKGRSPLMLAVRACVDSYWTRRRTPESVKALLDAGASITGVMLPSGYGRSTSCSGGIFVVTEVDVTGAIRASSSSPSPSRRAFVRGSPDRRRPGADVHDPDTVRFQLGGHVERETLQRQLDALRHRVAAGGEHVVLGHLDDQPRRARSSTAPRAWR